MKFSILALIVLAASAHEGFGQTVSNWFDVSVSGPWLPTGVLPADLESNSNDDTAAIQAAINYAASNCTGTPPSRCGGVVYFPAGTYNISSTLVVPTGPTYGPVTILGQGLRSNIYADFPGPQGYTALQIGTPGSGSTVTTGLSVRGLSISLVGASTSPPSWSTNLSNIGLALYSIGEGIFSDISIAGFGVGLKLAEASPNNEFSFIRTVLCHRGIWVNGASIAPGGGGCAEAHCNSVFNNCKTIGPVATPPTLFTEYGILVDGDTVGDIVFTDCWVAFASTGVAINKGTYYNTNVQFNNLQVDWSQQWGVNVQGVNAVRLQGGYVGVRGVLVQDANDPVISGVNFVAESSLATNSAAFQSGITFEGVKRGKVSTCTLLGWPHGIRLIKDSTTGKLSKLCSISGNTVQRSRIVSIQVQDSVNNTIIGNTIDCDGLIQGWGILENGTEPQQFNNFYGLNNWEGTFAGANKYFVASVSPSTNASTLVVPAP